MTATGSNVLGELWENYIIAEIDLVEERKGKLFGYKVKWKGGPIKVPNDRRINYPEASFEVIHRENYLQFIQ
jgi:hypothetical protein